MGKDRGMHEVTEEILIPRRCLPAAKIEKTGPTQKPDINRIASDSRKGCNCPACERYKPALTGWRRLKTMVLPQTSEIAMSERNLKNEQRYLKKNTCITTRSIRCNQDSEFQTRLVRTKRICHPSRQIRNPPGPHVLRTVIL